MLPERPDLSGLDATIAAYIEALEEEVQSLRQRSEEAERSAALAEPSEPPTSINMITVSAQGHAKRTPRHFYARQRRGGMGVFDMECTDGDFPAFLLAADEGSGIVLLTNHARAFRVPVHQIIQTPVRGRGQPLLTDLPLRANEKLSLVFPDQGGAYLSLISERGQVRRIGSQYLGKSLQPGTVLFDVQKVGAPAAWCWSNGNDEMFIATRLGRAIRFSERLVPVSGCLGMRVDPEDRVVAIATQRSEGGIFLLTADGKGTVRQLEGFSANKEPGTGGKTAMKSEELIAAIAVQEQTDIFIISQLSKIIRFEVAEVPAKEGVVQGVNCMALRSDICTAMVGSLVNG